MTATPSDTIPQFQKQQDNAASPSNGQLLHPYQWPVTHVFYFWPNSPPVASHTCILFWAQQPSSGQSHMYFIFGPTALQWPVTHAFYFWPNSPPVATHTCILFLAQQPSSGQSHMHFIFGPTALQWPVTHAFFTKNTKIMSKVKALHVISLNLILLTWRK